jgi:prevent-host-death family protein
MKVYSYSEARQHLADLLNRAGRDGEVEIRRRDGESFVVRPIARRGSPLDVPGVDTDLARGDVVELVRESRRSTGRLVRSKGSSGRSSKPEGRGAASERS